MIAAPWTRSMILCLIGAGLSACSVEVGGFGFVNDRSASVRVATEPALLGPDGSCGADANLDPATLAARPSQIAPGIGECDLVRLKGQPPTDVLIGESGRGQREVQVLYAEPGGRELYLFTDNKLTRIVKPGQG